jgi:hypothetical protein
MRTRPDEWNHTTIKRLADARKVRVGDLVALKEGNDPFLAGRPGRRRWAEWFAEHFRTWQAGRPGEVAHLRRIHYWLVSLAEPVLMPVLLTGKHKGQALPYVNDEHSWDRLLEAGKDARYLGLVGLDELEDHRTPPATLYLSRRAVQPSAHLEGGIQGRVVLPWPHLALDEARSAWRPRACWWSAPRRTGAPTWCSTSATSTARERTCPWPWRARSSGCCAHTARTPASSCTPWR